MLVKSRLRILEHLLQSRCFLFWRDAVVWGDDVFHVAP